MNLSRVSVLADWALALVGAAVFGLVAGQLRLDSDRLLSDVLEVAVPFVIAVFLVWFGAWLASAAYDTDERLRVAGWASVGLCLLSLLGAWEFFLYLNESVPVDEFGHQLVTQLSVGAFAGSVVGYYDIRQRGLGEQAELAQAAVETARDGIAIVNRDDRVVKCNDEFAAMFGYDHATIANRPLSSFLATDEFDALKREAVTALKDEGEWRCELTAERADGSTFPFDVSLAPIPGREASVVVGRDTTEQKRYAETIESLHGVTRDLMAAESETEVCRLVVQTARLLLDHELAGIWLVDENGTELRPEALTDASAELFDDVVVPIGDESRMSRAYTTGEIVVRNEISGDLQHSETEVVDSAVHVPLGKHGVLVVASRTIDTFSDQEVSMANLLGANATVALERAEREQTLQRQAEQLEFFNSILRHDVLNGLTVVRSRADVLAAHEDDEVSDMAETILTWCDDLTDIVERVRRIIQTLTGQGDPELEPVDAVAALRAELRRLESTYPDVEFEYDLPPTAAVLADELLAEVLGNVLSNAVEHNDPDGLCVSVSVIVDDGRVTVRIADDGRGIPADRREAVFRREERGHAKTTGSGFGLFFVDTMIDRYGGDITVEDGPDGGAAFVITLDAAEEH